MIQTPTDRHFDGTGWEASAGYSRAARSGCCIAVSGTTDHGQDGAVAHPGDTYAQAVAVMNRGVAAAAALGARLEDVTRTRLLLTPDADWEAAARAHAEVFGAVSPANTTVIVAGLIGEGFLIEVEIDACVGMPR